SDSAWSCVLSLWCDLAGFMTGWPEESMDRNAESHNAISDEERASAIERDARRNRRCLEDLAALGGAFQRSARLRPALALAGVLALARRRRGLAGALALARIDATTLDAIGMGSCRKRAGGEDRSSGGDESTLGHDCLPDRRRIDGTSRRLANP